LKKSIILDHYWKGYARKLTLTLKTTRMMINNLSLEEEAEW